MAKRTVFFWTPTDSPFQRIHPLSRILIGIVINFIPFMVDSVIFMAFLLFGTILLMRIGRSLNVLRTYSYVLSSLFIWMVLFYGILGLGQYYPLPDVLPNVLLYEWWLFRITTGGMYLSLLFFLRFGDAALGIIFILATCSERDFIVATRKARFPYVVSFVIALAIRFLTTFHADFHMIIQAQKGRGMEYDKISYIKRIALYASILTPLVMIGIGRAETIANATDSRAFSLSSKNKTDFKAGRYPIKSFDKLIISISLVLILGFLALRVYSWILGGPSLLFFEL